MSALDIETRVRVTGEELIRVNTQTTGGGTRIVCTYIGGEGLGARLVFQGDPEAMVRFFGSIHAEVVTAVGRAWPVEELHVAQAPAPTERYVAFLTPDDHIIGTGSLG